ncbi:hypothetical protein Xmau_04018 [Xenorhabdus mauleonii]|uniref:Uncharacterized protein n=1 Tax=Xenorhabdus mauleonii TaxID=351675 RepID=A0A1I3TQW9_9GAMM|nr:hypothetical protein [Xenorhabdus mauleonii]PHM37094.1 hypothetical protein Xmau_04018 [Xenorhabdus mauleonii]SFJ72031.1 hypothetical protein SAMN05421680_114102 [Xenorhabdus mauleonii]
MNNNDKSMSDNIAQNKFTVLRNVNINRLRTDYLKNNLSVEVTSPEFFGMRIYLLTYADYSISGTGIYLALLAALKNRNRYNMSLRVEGNPPTPAVGYISGIMIEVKGTPPDSLAPW